MTRELQSSSLATGGVPNRRVAGVVCLLLCRAVVADQPSAAELLDRYAANQDRLKSFIAKTEATTTHVAQGGSDQQSSVKRNSIEFRYEDNGGGIRAYYYTRPINRGADGSLVPEDSYRYLWDRKRYYEYFWTPALNDRSVFASRAEERMKQGIAIQYEGAGPILGILYGDLDRFDSILRQSDSMSVRDGMERVGSVDCYVIDANSRHGRYTVWLDPDHGYGVAKAKVYRGPEHLRFGRPRSSYKVADDTSTLSVQDVRFENVEGVWVPIEGGDHSAIDIEKGTHVYDTHYKITEMLLNPDHAKLGSFVLDVENGTKVRLEEAPGIKYTWRNGEIVSDIDEGESLRRRKAIKDAFQLRSDPSHPLPTAACTASTPL